MPFYKPNHNPASFMPNPNPIHLHIPNPNPDLNNNKP